jgi:hypothetical protein
MRRAFARSSRQYKKGGTQSFFRELRNRCRIRGLPPYLVSRRSARITCHCLGSTGERPVGWQSSTPGMSDCQGVLSALFANWKKFVLFDPKVFMPSNEVMPILHRSGRARSSSQCLDPKSLLRLLTYRRRALSASRGNPGPLIGFQGEGGSRKPPTPQRQENPLVVSVPGAELFSPSSS